MTSKEVKLSDEPMKAIMKGQLKEVKRIVEKYGLSFWCQGHSLLATAVRARQYEITKFLLEKGAKVHLEDEPCDSLLHLAVNFSQGACDFLELLLAYNAPIDCTNKSGRTPLHTAAFQGYENVVAYLLSKGASLSSPGHNVDTPLHLAVQNGHRNVVELLLSNGADVNAVGKCAQTPLHRAALKECERTAELLLRFGGSTGAIDDSRNTPLHSAARSARVARKLLENGAEANATNIKQQTPLHIAANNGSDSVIQVLLANKAALDAADKDGNRPLHLATPNNRLSTVALLLRNKAHVDARNSDGETPLHIAARYGALKVVEALLESNANLQVVNNEGDTPLHIAVRHSDLNLVTVLLEKNANLHVVNNQGDTPINRLSDPKMINTLLKFGANVNWQGKSNQTVLHHAVSLLNVETVLFLLSHGIDTNLEDSSQNTALKLALSRQMELENTESDDPPQDNFERLFFHDLLPSHNSSLSANDKIMKILVALKKHIIKMSIAGWHVSEKDLSWLHKNLDDDLIPFEGDCVEEVNCMKSEELYQDFTVCDILSNFHNLKLARNDNLMEMLKSFNTKQFPIYQSFLSFIISNLVRRKSRIELEISAQNSIKVLLRIRNLFGKEKTPDLPVELFEKILSFLNDNDLRALNTCRQELIR